MQIAECGLQLRKIFNPQSQSPIRNQLQPVSLRHPKDFVDCRNAAKNLEPCVFTEGVHAVRAGRLANFPAARTIVSKLANCVVGDAKLENALATDESQLLAAATSLRSVQRFATLFEFIPRKISRQIVLFRLERFSAIFAQRPHKSLGHYRFDRAGDEERFDAHIDEPRVSTGASFVWSVLNTKWPVSEAWIAFSAVSISRISPTSTMSGS